MSWLLKRTGQSVFTVWAVATISFGLIRLMPGGAEDIIVARIHESQGSDIPAEVIREQVQHRINIDPNAPVHEAYLQYMGGLVRGDFGHSVYLNRDVATILAEALPWTIFLMAISTLITFGLALSLGAMMAYKEGTRFDISQTGIAIFTTSVPYYVAAVLFIAYLGNRTSIFPARGRYPAVVEPGFNIQFVVGSFHHALLPAASFVLTVYGLTALSMRGNSIQILGEDYVRVARLRGLSDRRIALRYVGRNAVLPMYTSLLISIGFMFGGSIILEELFQYPGIGYYMYQAIEYQDMPLMMGTFLVITVAVVIALFVGDATYSKLDPRIKSGDDSESY